MTFSKISDVRFRASVFWYIVCSMQTDQCEKRRARRTWCEVVVACNRSMRMIVGEDAVSWHSLSERLVLCLADFLVIDQ